MRSKYPEALRRHFANRAFEDLSDEALRDPDSLGRLVLKRLDILFLGDRCFSFFADASGLLLVLCGGAL